MLTRPQDYSERAKDYNKKKKTLKSLRQKATERNEDEFYFGMMSRKGPGAKITTGKGWNGKVEGDRGNKSLDVNAVRLLKTQDIGYVRTMKQVVSKEVTRLEEQIVLTRGLDRLDEEDEDDEDEDFSDFDDIPKSLKKSAPRKITFLDTEEEREAAVDNAEEDEDNRDNGETTKDKEAQEFEREKSLRRLKKQLDLSRKKLKALKDAEGALEEQQAKMAKTATSGGISRRGKKLMVRARKR